PPTTAGGDGPRRSQGRLPLALPQNPAILKGPPANDTGEKQHERSVRRSTGLCARLRFPRSLHAADPRLLYPDRLHHAVPLGALHRRAVSAAEKAAFAI